MWPQSSITNARVGETTRHLSNPRMSLRPAVRARRRRPRPPGAETVAGQTTPPMFITAISWRLQSRADTSNLGHANAPFALPQLRAARLWSGRRTDRLGDHGLRARSATALWVL